MALVQYVTWQGFQIEIGSAAYYRLVDAELIPAAAPVETLAGIEEEPTGETVAQLEGRLTTLGVALPSVITKVSLEEALAAHTGTYGE